MKEFFIWVVVLGSVFVNHFFLKDQYFRKGIPLIDHIRYSDFLVQKWFLVFVAFVVFTVWLFKNRKGVWIATRRNILFILLIFIITFGVHIPSFQRWFEFDDYRLIGHHFAVSGTPKENEMGAVNNPYYGYAFGYLVVRWFTDSFELYNATGIIILILIGFVIFFISNVIQKNRAVSLLVALVFTTSTTYFRQILQMHEFLGDTFPLLLFSLAIYFSVKAFYPGAIIFAASAMEFGLSREHFIGVPLFLLVLFFSSKKFSAKRKMVLAFIFPLLTFFYLSVFLNFQPQIVNRSDWLSNWPQGVRFLDVIFGVTIPHLMSFAIFNFSHFVSQDIAYLSPILGLMFILVILALIVYNRKNHPAAKLLIIGLSIVTGSVVFQTLSGIRLEHNLSALHRQYLDFLPSAPTSYGLPAALGVSILFLGLSQIMKARKFYLLAFTVIVINSIGFLKADIEWIKRFSFPQRAANGYLAGIIPYDGKVKVIFTPHPHELLSRYISYFYQLYRIRDQVYWTNDPNELINLLNKYKPDKGHVFLLTFDKSSYEVYDKSELLRNNYTKVFNLKYLESLSP